MENLDSLINELNSLILQGKKVPLSNSEIILKKADLLDIVTIFRDNYPEIVRESEGIVKERESILQQATDYANSIMDDAEAKTKKMLENSNITKEANDYAARKVEEANEYYKKLEWQGRSVAYENIKEVAEQMKKSLDNLTENMNRLAKD